MVKNKLLILLVLGLSFFLVGCQEEMSSTQDTGAMDNDLASFDNNIPKVEEGSKHFDIVARQWFYEPSEIRVNQGDKVILSVSSMNVSQGFYSSDLGIDAQLVPGKTQVLEFDADDKGVYEVTCDGYCQKESLAMDLKIIIE